jgi:hypothetical protein
MTFIFYILSIWGLTHILVASKILEGFRNWLLINSPFFGDMLNCYQCTSFWASMILYFFFDSLKLDTVSFMIKGHIISPDFLLYSFIGSGLVSFIAVILSLLIKRSK